MAAAKLTLLRRLAKQAGIPRHTAAALDETWRRVMMRLLFVLIRTTVILEHIFVRDWVPSIDEVDEAEEHGEAGEGEEGEDEEEEDEDEDEEDDGEEEDEGMEPIALFDDEEEEEEEPEGDALRENVEGPAWTWLPTEAMVREAHAMLPSRESCGGSSSSGKLYI